VILDSSFVIDLLADDDAAVAKLDEIADRQLTVPTLVYTEVGVGFDPETATAARFEEIMQHVTLVAYDDEAARRAVGIQRQLRQQGDRVGAVDVMIAGSRSHATCPLSHGTSVSRPHAGTVSPY
jgi:Predicted nucleic acid-binding protein, contains PIN domain